MRFWLVSVWAITYILSFESLSIMLFFSIRISENMFGMLNATLCSKSMSELFLCMNLRPTASESAALTISNKVLVKSN